MTGNKVEGMDQKAPVQTTVREVSDETKKFIAEASKDIIKQAITKDDYDKYLCSVSVNYNEKEKEFDTAVINLFGIPQTTTTIVAVNQFVVDLKEQKIAATNASFSPVVMRKNQNGVDVDAVLIGRYGDISICSANIVALMMQGAQEEEAEQPTDEASEYADDCDRVANDCDRTADCEVVE